MVHDQFIGRVDREGRDESINVIYLMCNEGSDPPMVDLLGLKSAQSTAIVDPDYVFEVTENENSRIQLLAKQFLDKMTRTSTPISDPYQHQIELV